MKKLLFLFIPFMLAKTAGAQIIWSVYSQTYPDHATDKPENVGIIACIPEKNNAFWDIAANTPFLNELQNDAAFMNHRPANLVAINSFDTAKAHFFLHGVNRANASQWEYRVMRWPDKVLVPWGAVTQFSDKLVDAMSGMPPMAYLGGYAADLGGRIVVDARKRGSTEITSSAVVAWRSISPQVTAIYTPDQLNLFLTRLARPWSYKLTPEEAYRVLTRYKRDEIDQQSGLPKRFIAEPDENNLVFSLNSTIYNASQLQYQLVRNNAVIKTWQNNDFDNGFIWFRDLKPGDYQLNMRYTAQPDHVTTYPFLVKASWFASVWFKIAIWIVCALLIAFIILYFKFLSQKKKIARELADKDRLQLELKTIYSQLNPHFIFNALSSIQGLINKQDIQGANAYLADFAKLMRESLKNNNSDQAPLKQELNILDTYLKLEQLRFGFQYGIDVDEHINVFDTEIPSLMLQPLVENAVKHGVSALGNEGVVSVSFQKQQDDMAIVVADNGPGFSPGKITTGYGLKLTTDRTRLLNRMLKGQSIIFEVKGNSPSGAKIYLIFKNWFL